MIESKDKFPDYHPLAEFNDYLYMVSGSPYIEPIYIYKFNNNYGCLVKINVNTKSGTVKYLTFDSEYYWYEDKKTFKKDLDRFQTIDKLIDILHHVKGCRKHGN